MFEQCLFFSLNALVRDLNKIWEAQFEDLGLSPSLGYMLAAILTEPGMSQKELSQHLHLERSTVTRFLDTLEGKGLVKREAAAEDARLVRVVASEKGRTLKVKVGKAMKKVADSLDGRVAGQDVDNLLKIASRVREKLNS